MTQVIILIGAPGSGKGTQNALLSQHFNLDNITMGDIIRREIKEKTTIGNKVHKILQNGHLLPDEITIKLFMNSLTDSMLENGFISDGFPRTIAQARALDSLASNQNLRLIPILLEIDYNTIFKRLVNRKRSDDTQEIIKNRISIFNNEISAILKFYNKKLITVNANQDKQLLSKYIIEKIKS